MNKGDKAGRLIGTVITVAIVVFAVNFFTKQTNNPETRVKKEIEKYNKELPQPFDENTRIDSLTMPEYKILVYHYTVDIEKEKADYESIKGYIDPQMLLTVKVEPALGYLRKEQFTWKYLFYDRNGELFYEYIVTPDMYKK